MKLRSRILQASACVFRMDITADYEDQLHTFSMDCRMDSQGSVTFTVLKPDTIAGITGMLSGDGGGLTFEDTVLHFPMLADGRLSPVSAPWILMKTLRGGNMIAACEEEGRNC